MIAFVKEAWSLYRRKQAEEREANEKRAIAKAFNDRYTYRRTWIEDADFLPGAGAFGMLVRSGFAWMCPECNKIHHPIECSVFSGLQYPACCRTSAGNRLHERIRTR